MSSSSSSNYHFKRSDIVNFGAGPSHLPTEVLEQVKDELLNWNGSGMSVMEMSHRGKYFEEIQQETLKLSRDLLNIPDNYDTLLLQGGATTQFSAIPMNMLSDPNSYCDYLVTGGWSSRACEEASYFGNVNIIGNGKDKNYNIYNTIPCPNTWNISKENHSLSKYFYFCDNETVFGVESPNNYIYDSLIDQYSKRDYLSNSKIPPIVVDVSSNFYSRPINIENYSVIYGGAQKNLGPSGITFCIIDKQYSRKLCEYPRVPRMLKWKISADNDSRYNTPPTFSIYVMGRVLNWLKDIGGVDFISERNQEKSRLLYNALDSSDLFVNIVNPKFRSRMNIPFRIISKNDKKDNNNLEKIYTWNTDLENIFIKEAEKDGLFMLKGHRTAGGMRASLYNSIKIDETERLISFLEKFEDKYNYN